MSWIRFKLCYVKLSRSVQIVLHHCVVDKVQVMLRKVSQECSISHASLRHYGSSYVKLSRSVQLVLHHCVVDKVEVMFRKVIQECPISQASLCHG